MNIQFDPQSQHPFIPQTPQQFDPQSQHPFIPQTPQQFEPQIQQPFEPQIQQSFEPQVQSLEPQIQQSFEPQLQPIESQVHTLENQIQSFEPQIQPVESQTHPLEPQVEETFEPQIKQNDADTILNIPQNDTPGENQTEAESDNLVEKMIEVNTYPNKINSTSIFEGHKTYGLNKIFIFFIVQTAIYIVLCKVPTINKEANLVIPLVILGLSSMFLSILIKCYDGRCGTSGCGVVIYIFFFAYKAYLFVCIYFVVRKLDLKNFYCSKYDSTSSDTSNNKTNLGNFDIAHIAIGAYYLALCICTFLGKMNLLLFLIIGGGVVVMFCSLLAINVMFALFTTLLIAFEILVLLLVLKILISKDKLDEEYFMNNILLIDYCKYIVIIGIASLLTILIIYLIICLCCILNTCCNTNYKIEYVDAFGNRYDEYHRRIEPDSCIVF